MEIDIILEPDLAPDEIKELGLLAENSGIRTIWAQNYASARDPFMSLVPLAQAAERIGLGVVVVSPWEMHPLKMANALLTLNEFCHGRASIVVGGGGEWCGVMAIEYGKRVRAVRETVEILRSAVTGALPDYQGELYKARGYRAGWATDTPPLIYTGAGKEQMIRMSARVADGIMLSDAIPQHAVHAVKMIHEVLAESNRPATELHINNFWAWHVKEDVEAAYREARRELIIRSWLDEDHISPFLTDEECEFVEANKWAFIKAYRDRTGDIEGVPEQLVKKLIANITTTGDAADMDRHIEQIQAFKDAGLGELALRVHDDPADAIKTIGQHIVPAMR